MPPPTVKLDAKNRIARGRVGVSTALPEDPAETTVAYIQARARELEARDNAVVRQILNRLDLYYVQWRVHRRQGHEYVPHPMGRFVADRAMDMLLATPHRLSVESDDESIVTDEFERALDRLGVGDLRERQRILAEWTEESARERSDEAEATLRRLMRRAEGDRRIELDEGVVQNAIISAYAGPTRVGYDETATEGESPLTVQVLDRRFYHEDAPDGPHGPEEVLYSRRGRLRDLLAEGWAIDDLHGSPETPAAIHDYWRVRRVNRGSEASPRWEKEIWNGIVVELSSRRGGQAGTGAVWTKEMALMKGPHGPLTRIPYAIRAVRPTTIRTPEFDAYEANGFLDVLWLLFDPMSRVLSWNQQLTRLAADPNVTVTSPGTQLVDVDVSTPGTVNPVPQGTKVDINLEAAQAQVMANQGTRLSDLAEKATLSGASMGQGIYQSSGLMTMRLQQAGAKSLISTQSAARHCIRDTYKNLADVARAYLGPEAVAGLTGREELTVLLPAVDQEEALQLLSAVLPLARPDGRGVGLVSEDTALEMAGLAYPALEEQKKLRQAQLWRDSVLQRDLERTAAQQEQAGELQPPPGRPVRSGITRPEDLEAQLRGMRTPRGGPGRADQPPVPPRPLPAAGPAAATPPPAPAAPPANPVRALIARLRGQSTTNP